MMKILAPDWQSKSFVHSVVFLTGFSFLCPTTSSCFKSFEFDFLSQVVCAKNSWESSATAIKKFLKVNFRVSQETTRDCLSQKLKFGSELFG